MIRALTLATLLAVGLGSAAQAQTIGYADAVGILARDCGQDIQRHCSTATLANFGITDCLHENSSNISGQCGTALINVRELLAARQRAQANIGQACQRDVQRLCPMTEPRNGFVLRCLLTAQRSVSNACNQAITDAGWR